MGNLDGRVDIVSSATGATLHTFTGTSQVESFGIAVASAGDVNDDGVEDVIIGGRGTPNVLGTDDGRAYVFSTSGLLLYTMNLDSPEDQFGNTVASVGDLTATVVTT